MQINNRDLAIIAFVGRFGQVTHKHVRRVIFSANASENPCTEALKRLTKQKLLVRIEKRTVGGANGGSGQYVYQIGPAGWKLSSAEGTYWQARSVNYHSLAIASVYADINESLDVIRFETEPDSHVKINYVPLLPDLYVEFKNGPIERRVWLEVDLGSERPKQLKDKLRRYHDAWNGAGEHWDPWPYVVWILPDERRKAELDSLIALTPKESRPMFRTALFSDVVSVLLQ